MARWPEPCTRCAWGPGTLGRYFFAGTPEGALGAGCPCRPRFAWSAWWAGLLGFLTSERWSCGEGSGATPIRDGRCHLLR